MSGLRKFIQPKSKYNKSIPYTYEATVDVLHGYNDEHLYNVYISDTICGLIEYLDDKNVPPVDVKLRGVYRDKEIELDIQYCISEDGNWLKRPNICKSLEEQYKLTMEECYKGHTGVEDCLYNDRETKGSGPY